MYTDAYTDELTRLHHLLIYIDLVVEDVQK
jgi:hypothetical protein